MRASLLTMSDSESTRSESEWAPEGAKTNAMCGNFTLLLLLPEFNDYRNVNSAPVPSAGIKMMLCLLKGQACYGHEACIAPESARAATARMVVCCAINSEGAYGPSWCHSKEQMGETLSSKRRHPNPTGHQ